MSKRPGVRGCLLLVALTFTALSASCQSNDSVLAPEDPMAILDEFEENLDFAQVEFVRARLTGTDLWRFDVTLRHEDEGWNHYADLWEVVNPQTGSVYAQRVLAHPHETEQPFTRSQSGIEIPASISQVLVRATCNVHGYGGKATLVDLSLSSGDGFEIVR